MPEVGRVLQEACGLDAKGAGVRGAGEENIGEKRAFRNARSAGKRYFAAGDGRSRLPRNGIAPGKVRSQCPTLGTSGG